MNNCSTDCLYYKQSKEYIKAKEFSEAEQKLRNTFLPFFQTIEGEIIKVRKERFTDLVDTEVKEALEQNLSNLSVKKKGIIYEYKSLNPKVQILAEAIDKTITPLFEKRAGPQNSETLTIPKERLIDYEKMDLVIRLLKKEIEFLSRLINEKRGETYYLDLISVIY